VVFIRNCTKFDKFKVKTENPNLMTRLTVVAFEGRAEVEVATLFGVLLLYLITSAGAGTGEGASRLMA
jgi:hypothetical protein